MSTEQVMEAPDQLRCFKSSYSGSDGGDCIEIATAPRSVHVRDSKDADGPILRFSAEERAAFVSFARESPASGD